MPSMLGLSVALPLLGLARSWHVFSPLIQFWYSRQCLVERFDCSFLDISCCNEMHGCWHGAAMMASAAALLYTSLKFVVQAAAAVPVAAKDGNYVPCFLFVVGGIFTTALLLASAASASEGINMRMEKHAVAASAAAPVSKNAHDCSFVSAGVLELLSLLEPAAAFVGLTVKIFMRAVAPAAAWTLLHVFGVPFAIAGLCHVFVICLDMAGRCHVIGICWNILDWMHWKCVCQEDLARFASGSFKKQSYTLSKDQSSDSVLQASTQALTLEDDGDLVTFKGWDGHSIDGSPSLGKGQATGRVDVPVDAIATSFDYVGVET